MYPNESDICAQLADAGLILTDGLLEIGTAKPVRCYTTEDRKEKRGWYWVSTYRVEGTDYLTGAFGIYQGQDCGWHSLKLNLDGKAILMSNEDREANDVRRFGDR